MSDTRVEICGCSVCGETLYKGDHLADHIKYDWDGDVDYIELAHVACAQSEHAAAIAAGLSEFNTKYWEWDDKPLTPLVV